MTRTFPSPAHGLPEPQDGWAIFLDVDGTLIEIAETPDGVGVDPRLVPALDSLVRATGGAVALVSGRPIAVLDRLFAPLRPPAAGLHGFERRNARGDVFRLGTPPAHIAEARKRLDAFARHRPGILVEDKGFSLALHYRGAPEREAEARRAANEAAGVLGPGVHVLAGKMVFEVKPRGANKGAVIEAFMEEAPFRDRTPVFIGDDVTDEDGFAVVNRMGGHTIRVGGDWPTHARWQVETVGELLDWIIRLPARLTRRRASVADGGEA